ncbi:hypothetical protein [Actinoplanes sp. NPDC026670]|uniref:hypothetical protein n=1 Tax=Actinoplanes sp. NPDC026670 TaxID=3154700 RepID=UPI003406B0C1
MVVTSRGPDPGGPHQSPSGPERRPLLMINRMVAGALGRTTAAVNREARRRPALSAALVVAGLGVVIVSVSGPGSAAPEFRSPPVAAMATPSVQVSAAAVYTGLAPYAPPVRARGSLSPSPRTSGPAGRSGSPSPVPSVTDDAATVLSGVRELPPEKTPTGAAPRTAADPVGPATPVTATVAVTEPRDGDSVTTATTITGTAELPAGHQVWLLSRHGSGSYRVEGACRGDRSFTCGPATLDGGGDDTFQLTAVVVDPATARALQAGETRDSLPTHLARSEVTVHRAPA